jgi:hypothetical protein
MDWLCLLQFGMQLILWWSGKNPKFEKRASISSFMNEGHMTTVDPSDQKAQWLFPRNRIFGKSHF